MNLTEYLADDELVERSKNATAALHALARLVQPDEHQAPVVLMVAAAEWFQLNGLTNDQIRDLLEKSFEGLALVRRRLAGAPLEVVK